MSWRGFTSGNITCPRASVFFPLKSSQCRAATGLVSPAGFPASLRQRRSHAADYSNMRGEIGFYFGSLWASMPSAQMLTNQETFDKPQRPNTGKKSHILCCLGSLQRFNMKKIFFLNCCFFSYTDFLEWCIDSEEAGVRVEHHQTGSCLQCKALFLVLFVLRLTCLKLKNTWSKQTKQL